MVSISFVNLLAIAGLVAAGPVSPREDGVLECPNWTKNWGVKGAYCCIYSGDPTSCCNRYKNVRPPNKTLDCDSRWWTNINDFDTFQYCNLPENKDSARPRCEGVPIV
ncbi:hypothetical protein PspLS_10104 [Pyricularia sp. CBS 133598]|nr:hypothetical protein PspLS_10104 [Pyricularia sp. CBS 133598]